MTRTVAVVLTTGRLCRNSARSRFGWLLVCLHAAWFFVAIANMSPPAPGFGAFLDGGGRSSATLLAGRPFHWHYESLLLKSLFLADLPSILAMVPVNLVVLLPLTPLHLGFYVISYLTAAIWLLGASVQWLVVGSWLEQRIESTTWGRRHRQ